jgi:formiminotetrahydrofolate cyclodeaminase
MDELRRLSFEQMFERAASVAPSPGGGAVMGLCGMMGVALLLKAVRITLRHREDETLTVAEAEFVRLAGLLAGDADADATSFDAYMAAGRLPRGSDQETAVRAERLAAAALDSVEVALAALAHAAEAMTVARRISARLSPRMVPDLSGGLALLEAVRANAVDNARDSLDRTEGSSRREALAARLGRLISETAEAVERG